MRKNIYDDDLLMIKENDLWNLLSFIPLKPNEISLINMTLKQIDCYKIAQKATMISGDYALDPYGTYNNLLLFNMLNEYQNKEANNIYLYSNYIINAYLFATIHGNDKEIYIKRTLEEILTKEAGQCYFSLKYLQEKYDSIVVNYILARKDYNFNNEFLMDNDQSVNLLTKKG